MMEEFDIHTLRQQPEGQQFDRKSFRIDAKSLAVILVAFANADGGDVVIGIEDDGRITGINGNDDHLNELLRAPFDFCVPSVKIEVHFIDCTDANGAPNRVLVMHVEPSMQVHANQADDAFYRVGDKSKKLNFEMRMQLFYAKGGRYYEDEPVYGATMDDIDLDYVKQYCDKIGYAKDAETYLRTNKGYVTTVNGVDKVSGAAILLFGKDPQKFFQRARIRIVRYDGDEERFGREMNVVKDVSFEGRIVEMTQKAIDFVDTQIKEYSFLGEDARFVTIPQYPLFCWTELIVNAVAHRDYSILGTDILVKIFDHHYVVESPGILPGMVRIDNIRQMHFSRNPKIVQFMQQYKLVKEFGEGVDRMFREMAEAGNPAPEYKQIDFMLKVKLTSAMREEKDAAEKSNMILEKSNMKSNMILEKSNMKGEKSSVKNEQLIIETIKANPSAPIPIFQKITGLSRSGIWKILNRLRENGIVRRIGSDRDGYWEIVEKVTQESPPETDGVGIDEKVNEKVNERQRLIISAIINNPHITQAELAKMLEISLVHVNKNMKKLQENGIIRRVGPDKGGHWEVIENGQCTIDNEQ